MDQKGRRFMGEGRTKETYLWIMEDNGGLDSIRRKLFVKLFFSSLSLSLSLSIYLSISLYIYIIYLSLMIKKALDLNRYAINYA